MRAAMPIDALILAATDPDTMLGLGAGVVHDMPQTVCAPFWEYEFEVPDFNKFTDLARGPRPVADLHAATGGRPERSARWRELRTLMDSDAELRATFTAGGRGWGLLQLNRAGAAHGFREEEVDFVASIAPVVGRALRQSLISHPAQGTAVRGPGMAIVGPDCRVVSATPEAIAWFDELESAYRVPDPVLGRDIPSEVTVATQAARAGTARTRARTRSGVWMLIHASRLHGSDATAVVIEPAKASEVAPLIVEAYGLTPREVEVTRALARGLTTIEIAARPASVPLHGPGPPEVRLREGRRLQPRRAGREDVRRPLLRRASQRDPYRAVRGKRDKTRDRSGHRRTARVCSALLDNMRRGGVAREALSGVVVAALALAALTAGPASANVLDRLPAGHRRESVAGEGRRAGVQGQADQGRADDADRRRAVRVPAVGRPIERAVADRSGSDRSPVRVRERHVPGDRGRAGHLQPGGARVQRRGVAPRAAVFGRVQHRSSETRSRSSARSTRPWSTSRASVPADDVGPRERGLRARAILRLDEPDPRATSSTRRARSATARHWSVASSSTRRPATRSTGSSTAAPAISGRRSRPSA